MTPAKTSEARTVLVYAQDTRGLGHVNRSLTILRHLLASHSHLLAYLVTKSPVGCLFTLPPRCDYIKLPARLRLDERPETPEQRERAEQPYRALRSQLLREVALGLKPDLVLVDHEPLGSRGEFREGLYALKDQHPRTRLVCGLRDITDEPTQVRALWRRLGVYEALETMYDGIAVYGMSELYDVAEAYAIPPAVRPKLHYCGFIVRERPNLDPAAVRLQLGLPAAGPLVLATVGSGSDGYPVLEATWLALEHLRSRFTGLVAVLVTGPFMPGRQQAALQRRATTAWRVLTRADNYQLMFAADAIVTMGGYNSICEALAAARPLVIVPRATHKLEQQIRAETLAAHGLARWVHPKELEGHSLAEALEWALCCDHRAYEEHVREVIPTLAGAADFAGYLSQWLGNLDTTAAASSPTCEFRTRQYAPAESVLSGHPK